MHGLNSTSMLARASHHQTDAHSDIGDAFVYVIIIMMFYAACIILMMARYAQGGSSSSPSGDYYRSSVNRETLSLLGPSAHDELDEHEDQEQMGVIRFFRTFVSKKGTRHSLDLDDEDINSGAMV